jgi:hypothetical protein
MSFRPFTIPKSKSTPKRVKIADTIEVAARYFVYKLYEATDDTYQTTGALKHVTDDGYKTADVQGS